MGSFRVLYAVAVRFVFYVYSEKRGIFSFRAGARGRGCRFVGESSPRRLCRRPGRERVWDVVG